VAKVDYEYEITEERVRAYLKVPEIDRLRWLEELCAFTKMAREAPTVYSASRPADTRLEVEPLTAGNAGNSQKL
jgi:hypothetical protein